MKTNVCKPLRQLVATLAITLLLLPTTTRAIEADDTLIFGFLPILSTQKLITRFKPLVDHLSQNINRPIRIETAPNFSEFLKRTAEGRYDILFTAPHFYYVAHKENGYRVILRVNEPGMTAIIVATRNSHISSIEELKGKRIAIPDPISLAALLIRNRLHEAGLEPGKNITIVTTPSHNAALLTAYNGVTDAAGLMMPPYRHASDEIHKQMIELAQTDATPHMPIAVSASLEPQLVNIITDTLSSLNDSDQGRTLLKGLGWPTGLISAKDSEYESLKAIVKELHIE